MKSASVSRRSTWSCRRSEGGHGFVSIVRVCVECKKVLFRPYVEVFHLPEET